MQDNPYGKIRIAVLENGLISTYTAREALMLELVAKGFEVFVLTQTDQFHHKVKKLGVHIIDIGSANYNPLKIGGYLYHLRSHLKDIRPDICLTFSIRPAIWGNLISQQLQIPVITNITGTGPLFSSKSIAYRIIRKVYPHALKKTRKIFFQNSADQREFIKRKFADPEICDLIPGSGVDYNKFYPIPHATDSSAFRFLYIGRLLRDKGVTEFVHAAKAIKSRFENAKFQIIGPLWKQNTKSNTIALSEVNKWVEEGTIEYLGEKEDVRDYIAASDCIVLPSYREGTSNVLLEASSMERPCIASNVPGCREVIDHGKTGLLCKARSVDDLIEKMQKMILMGEDNRSKMGKQARRKMILEFGKEIVIDRYLGEIYHILSDYREVVHNIEPYSREARASVSYVSTGKG